MIFSGHEEKVDMIQLYSYFNLGPIYAHFIKLPRHIIQNFTLLSSGPWTFKLVIY